MDHKEHLAVAKGVALVSADHHGRMKQAHLKLASHFCASDPVASALHMNLADAHRDHAAFCEKTAEAFGDVEPSMKAAGGDLGRLHKILSEI